MNFEMNFIVDIIIVALVILSALLAYRKGLITLSIQLCATIISIVVIIFIYKPVSNFIINTTSIDETIENTILEKATELAKDKNETELIDTIKQGMLPETARNLSINIVQGLVILLLYIGLRLALRFVTALANFVAKLPILKQCNKFGGAIYGILRGLLIIYVALLIVNLIGEINPENKAVKAVEESTIGNIMSDNNVLNVFFNG